MTEPIHTNNGALKYDVLLEQTHDNGYTARLSAWPDIFVQAPTREKALQQMRILLQQRLAKIEIVTLEIQPTEINHSWAPFAGDWANDPWMEDYKAGIEQYRREVDAIHAPWMFEPEECSPQEKPAEKDVVVA